jgi:hypothetical protein
VGHGGITPLASCTQVPRDGIVLARINSVTPWWGRIESASNWPQYRSVGGPKASLFWIYYIAQFGSLRKKTGLDGLANSLQLKALLLPCADERLKMWPVHKKVGNVRNNSGGLVERVIEQDLLF